MFLHEPEKLLRLEALMQRGVSSDSAGVGSSDAAGVSSVETNTLTGIPFSNNAGQFQTFASVWTVRFKMLYIGENNVVRPVVVEGKGFFIVARRIYCMPSLHQPTFLDCQDPGQGSRPATSVLFQ